MNSLTAKLLRVVACGANPDVNLAVLLTHAKKNKILLHLLRALNIEGPLREQQELGISEVTKVIQTLSKLLTNYNYVFFKLVKPVRYVPADVDLLIEESQVVKAAHRIMGLGYRVAVKDPYCLTLTKGDSIIDLYVHPSLGGVIFINGQKLLEHKCLKEFDGNEVISLEGYAEALVAASHAIYKERIYTLNDYLTVEEWTSKKTIKLSQQLNCEEVLKTAINVNGKISRGMLQAPYRIPFSAWLPIWTRKLQKDSLTRATSMNILRTLPDKRTGKLLISKLVTET